MDNNEYISKQKVEKWTTKEKFNALGDLRDIEPGTEYNITGAIEEGELDSALQTKINGKLTKPTNPSAESAVTMLADGTVGTKPLSEIGGGKLYRHELRCTITGISGIGTVEIYVINTSGDAITDITSVAPGYYTTYFYEYQKYGFGYLYVRVNYMMTMSYVAINDSNQTATFDAEKSVTISSISDIYTEI